MEGIRIIRRDHPEKKMYKCGHEGPKAFFVKIFRVNEEIKDNERCPDCAIDFLRKFVIACSFCGRPIIPGQQVSQNNFGIGCLNRMCQPGFVSGTWNGREVMSYTVKAAAK